MLKRTFFAFLAIAAAGAVMAQAYRWVDANGVVHYSDRPVEGAEQILLPQSNQQRRPTPAPRTRPTQQAAPAEPAQQEDVGYESLTIASPAAEETLWNIEGVLNVSLNIQPGLRQGHRVRVYFDGTPQMVTGANFQLTEVWRGVHNLQAEVVDANGALMIRSQPSRFYVQQNAIGR